MTTPTPTPPPDDLVRPERGASEQDDDERESEEFGKALEARIASDLRDQVWCLQNPTLLTSGTLSRFHDRGWVLVSAFYDPRNPIEPYTYILQRDERPAP
jgi:hypothetical protein